MKKSISKRVRITKQGKILRRTMGLGHCRANKRRVQQKRRKFFRGLDYGAKIIKKHQ